MTEFGGGAHKATSRNRTDRAVKRTKRRRAPEAQLLYGTPTQDTDPAEVLLQEIRRTAGHIEWLRGNLQKSDPEAFVRSLWLTKRQSGYIKDTEIDMGDFSQAGAMWLELYQSERRHLATICRTALAAGIEERRIRLAERQAERIGEAIRGMLYDLDIDPEDDKVREVVWKWLTQASGVAMQETQRRSTLPLEVED
jgi:hypothetical protein